LLILFIFLAQKGRDYQNIELLPIDWTVSVVS
jgi:hypothetical protein